MTICAKQDAVVQDIEDHIRQAQSIMWLASKYDEGRQSMRSTTLSTSSSYSSSPGQASQVRILFPLNVVFVGCCVRVGSCRAGACDGSLKWTCALCMRIEGVTL